VTQRQNSNFFTGIASRTHNSKDIRGYQNPNSNHVCRISTRVVLYGLSFSTTEGQASLQVFICLRCGIRRKWPTLQPYKWILHDDKTPSNQALFVGLFSVYSHHLRKCVRLMRSPRCLCVCSLNGGKSHDSVSAEWISQNDGRICVTNGEGCIKERSWPVVFTILPLAL
jgi:hypothetical protein